MLPLVFSLAFVQFAHAFPKLPGSNLLPWKRSVFEERQAEAQPTCSCEPVDPAASAFMSYEPFAAAASAAPLPAGYVNAFTNENSYCNADGGLGFTTLDTYDSELCANLCDTVEGCAAFTLYYEKDAVNHRGTDVASSASIKCAFWAGSVSAIGSSSRGSESYNAVIAGSNGYTSKTITNSVLSASSTASEDPWKSWDPTPTTTSQSLTMASVTANPTISSHWGPGRPGGHLPGTSEQSTVAVDTTQTVVPMPAIETPAPTPSLEPTSNYTGWPPSYNFTGLPFNMSHMIYSPRNNSWYCELTHLWYPANGNLSPAGLNFTMPSANSSFMTNTTTTTSAVVDPTSTTSIVPSVTPAPQNSTPPWDTPGVMHPSYNYSSVPFNASHMIYSPSNDSFYCELTHRWYPAGNVSNIPGFNMSTITIFNGTSSWGNYAIPWDTAIPDNSTTVNTTSTSTTSSTSDVPTPTPDPTTAPTTNSTYGIYPSTYNGTYASWKASTFNSSHLIFYPNGSVWCDYTRQLYPANNTSWLSLINGTYSSFNASGYSMNSTYGSSPSYSSNSTNVNATSTPTTSTPTANVTDPSPNSTTITNTTGVYPSYNATFPSFNMSTVNPDNHLIFYPNGSVWCDYSHELYPANDTSWMSWLNGTFSGFNSSTFGGFNLTGFSSTGYSYNATSPNVTTPANPTNASTPTPMPDPVANSTGPVSNTTAPANTTGVFPSYNGTLPTSFDSSVWNSSDHLIFYSNGSVWCDYTRHLYAANDTSWLSLLNKTSSAFNASAYGGFNSTGYAYNVTATSWTTPVANTTATNTTTSVDPTGTATPTPDPVANSTTPSVNMTIPSNTTGIFPAYNNTLWNTFNSSILNSTDHLIFYANGSIWCDYTHHLYPANDTSWWNTSYPLGNSTGYSYSAPGGFNATLYSSNVTTVNSTVPVDNTTTVDPTDTSVPTPTPTPGPVDNSTAPTNATGVYPSLNGTSTFPSYSDNGSAMVNSTNHLIFYANGSVFCEYTQKLYAANDTSWMSLLDAYSSLNSTNSGYTYPSTNSTGGYVAGSAPAASPAADAADASAGTTDDSDTTGGLASHLSASYNRVTNSSLGEDSRRRWIAPRNRLRTG